MLLKARQNSVVGVLGFACCLTACFPRLTPVGAPLTEDVGDVLGVGGRTVVHVV